MHGSVLRLFSEKELKTKSKTDREQLDQVHPGEAAAFFYSPSGCIPEHRFL
ncbi:hypothetical protein ACFSC6_15420 [Rufibacter sediminis]